MRLDTIACGPLGVNTYVVSAEDAATCAVIDPGDAAPVLERLRTGGSSARTSSSPTGILTISGVRRRL